MMRKRMFHSNIHDIFYSLINSELSALDKYVANGGSLKITGPDRKSLLIGAIEDKQECVFNRCLELGCDLEAADDLGMTALHWAADEGLSQYVKTLLHRGARVDRQDKAGNTALLFAVYKDHLEIIKLLLDAGSSVNIKNEDGYTALHSASSKMNIGTLTCLLQNGANSFLRTCRGDSPISLALLNKDLKIVQIILENNRRSCEGSVYAPDLHMAVGKRYFDAVLMLLSYGVDPFPSEQDCLHWTEVLTSCSSRRLRESLISEYGYFTSAAYSNKLILYIFKNHLFLQYFSLLKLMFLYGFQTQGMLDLLECKESCRCRKVLADIQKMTNYQSPAKLQVLCRNRVRVSLGFGVVRKVALLPLPHKVKRYLSFVREYCQEKPLI